MNVVAEAEKSGRSLCLCFRALTSWLQEELLSWLPSIVFDHLYRQEFINSWYRSVLSAHGVVLHRHTPSTELTLLHDPIRQLNEEWLTRWCNCMQVAVHTFNYHHVCKH